MEPRFGWESQGNSCPLHLLPFPFSIEDGGWTRIVDFQRGMDTSIWKKIFFSLSLNFKLKQLISVFLKAIWWGDFHFGNNNQENKKDRWQRVYSYNHPEEISKKVGKLDRITWIRDFNFFKFLNFSYLIQGRKQFFLKLETKFSFLFLF